MKSIILILFNTKKGLELLDNEFEDHLNRKSNIIFGVYAIIIFLFSFDLTAKTKIEFVFLILQLILTIGFSILVGTFFSYLLFKIGERLNGKATYIEIFSLFAYSFIPIIIGLTCIGVLKNTEFFIHEYNNSYLRNSLLCISWLLSIDILFQGFIKFNKYSILNAVINIAPLLILQIGTLISNFYL
ncbi:YIP1 family protein [uncultured Tenacibaculum sp.]|uniref:YIP1 family protein n=1 Tax=uncultured Tenacibaculum sp. TaxID=174713 RepID=UPI00260398FB|nr:YIP1 family protein [uncultured Tenacibaculum sp.]